MCTLRDIVATDRTKTCSRGPVLLCIGVKSALLFKLRSNWNYWFINLSIKVCIMQHRNWFSGITHLLLFCSPSFQTWLPCDVNLLVVAFNHITSYFGIQLILKNIYVSFFLPHVCFILIPIDIKRPRAHTYTWRGIQLSRLSWHYLIYMQKSVKMVSVIQKRLLVYVCFVSIPFHSDRSGKKNYHKLLWRNFSWHTI